METVPSREMLCSVRRGFKKALSATHEIVRKHELSAAARLSSKFVYDVAFAVKSDIFPDYDLKVVGVKSDGTKSSGEWLVDACITENIRVRNPHGPGCTAFVGRIAFAMESESAPGTQDFNDDFAKLAHLDASVKLYLNGLSQTSSDGMAAYISRRREYAQDLIRRTRSGGQWFLGFWPSPGKLEGHGDVSAWECLPSHLRTLRLFELRREFVEAHGSNAA